MPNIAIVPYKAVIKIILIWHIRIYFFCYSYALLFFWLFMLQNWFRKCVQFFSGTLNAINFMLSLFYRHIWLALINLNKLIVSLWYVDYALKINVALNLIQYGSSGFFFAIHIPWIHWFFCAGLQIWCVFRLQMLFIS